MAGDYVEGVRLLSELFVTTMDATFIYNQGRCFEQNRRYEDAIGRFQEFLRAGKKLTKAEKAQAEKHIDDCRELLASERAQAAPVAVAALPPVVAPPVAPAAVAIAPAPSRQPALSSPGSAGSGLRTAGILTASVGGAALIAGIVLNLKSNSLAADLKKTDGYAPAKESNRKSYQTLSWFGYGAGAACVAAGAILYFIGSGSRGASEPSVAFVPAVGQDYAGADVKGAF